MNKDILFQCEKAYQEKMLELLSLKVGDCVDCYFSCHTGNSKRSYSTNIVGKGVIVKTEKGIFVKSINKYPQSHEKRRYPMRPSPTYWHFENEYVLSKLDNIIVNNYGVQDKREKGDCQDQY